MISGGKCDFVLQKSLNTWGFKAIHENGDSVDAVEYISGVKIINASVSPESFFFA